MSNSLGALGVDVFANTASFESDMGRAARVAERDMKAVERAATMAGKAIAGIAVAGLTTFAFAVKQSIELRSALDDMADVTGDSVESLDGLRRTAYIAGVEMEKLQNVIVKTSKGLDTKAGQSAIAAIGLDIERLRALKPAEAMQEIAQALAKYEDGQQKINAAAAIWGSREGPRMLALMKDLAEAGVQQGRITAQMAQEAEKAEKEWRRLVLAFKDFKDGIAGEVIPWIGRMIEQMNEGIRIAGSFGAALRLFGMSNVTADSVGALRKELEQLERLRDKEAGRKNLGAVNALDRDIADVTKRLEFAKFLERQKALKKTGPGFEDARDAMSRRRPVIEGVAAEEEGKSGRAARDTTMADMARAQQQVQDIIDEANVLGVRFLQQQQAAALKSQAEQSAETYRAWVETAKVAVEAAEGVVYTWDEAGNRIEIARDQFDELEKAAKKTDDTSRQLGLTFSSAFEDAVLSGRKLSDVLRGLAKDVARIFLRKTVTEPLAEAASGFFKKLDFGSMLPSFDVGTPFVPHDMIAKVHKGEAIIPASENRRGSANGGPTFNVDMRGASVEAVQRLEAFVMRLDGTLEMRATAAVFEEQLRGNRV